MIPKELERAYQVMIVYGEFSKKSIVRLRDLKAPAIGSLATIRGVVVRSSDVKP
jgi:DNA replicative helicase MCM subunit Mcm2 (Cdc46/Mcm family)